MKKVRVGILISGRGSNMQALVEAARAPDYPAEIACVISNTLEAKGLEFAAANGIETTVFDHNACDTREEFEGALDYYLRNQKVDLIACAGFMRVLSQAFVEKWEDRILNIHPSLLPAYKGLHTHERVLSDGAKLHGCTVHIVTAKLDDGPIVLQAQVPVFESDTPDSLAARVLAEEHRIYPQALAMRARKLQAKTST